MRTILILALLVMGLVSSASAQQILGEYDYVRKVTVGMAGNLFISVPGNFAANHGCSNRAFVVSIHKIDDNVTKAWLQIANASFLARAKVHVWTQGCNPGGYPVMVKLQMFQ